LKSFPIWEKSILSLEAEEPVDAALAVLAVELVLYELISLNSEELMELMVLPIELMLLSPT
jgi:hypothetical protein